MSEIKEEKIRKAFIEDLPKRGKTKQINWKESIKHKIKFIHGEIEGEFEIVDYIRPNLYIKYLDKEPLKISVNDFQKGNFGKMLGIRTNEFKIEIGDVLKDDKHDLIITDRKIVNSKGENRKYYKYKCNKCGFDCGEYYKDGKYKEEHWILEGNLLGKGKGCSCCSNQIVVPHINSIVTYPETHWMIPYFQGGYDEAKRYTKTSTKKLYFICQDCGRKKQKEIRNMHRDKSISCECSDGIRYPEKFMFNVLEQLQISFKTQLSKSKFKWCDKYKYDFYIPSLNIIIETHGIQHYEDNSNFTNSLEEQIEIDNVKKELALKNNIKKYITIDCRYSNMCFIKENILKSELNKLLDLSSVDWFKCEEFALGNRVKEACNYKKNNPNMTTKDIGEIMNLGINSIRGYLKKGNLIGWCKYDPKEELLKGGLKGNNIAKQVRKKQVAIFKENESLGVFQSVVELDSQSEELFGIKLDFRNISAVCLGKRKTYKGFTFKYVS